MTHISPLLPECNVSSDLNTYLTKNGSRVYENISHILSIQCECLKNVKYFWHLLVANKFQTGFDQPLLCGMYVDKRLAGIQAVQTLSRLNRRHDGKDTTYVIDFVNDPEEVLKSFKQYHTTAQLSDSTDPNLVFDLKAKL